jgi:hypothetical protein
MFEDPVHLSREGGLRSARWLLPQVEDWYGCSSPAPRVDCTRRGGGDGGGSGS